MSSHDSPVAQIAITHTWNGLSAEVHEHVTLELQVLGAQLRLRVDAPWHGDPLPAVPVGPCEGLWEYEVVELFLLGAGERYLEIELGPGGHHLALELAGRRTRVRSDVPLDVHCQRSGARWCVEARLPLHALPSGLCAWNAYAIHGEGAARRYLAFQPLPGERPDFHQLEHFASLPMALRQALGRLG